MASSRLAKNSFLFEPLGRGEHSNFGRALTLRDRLAYMHLDEKSAC